MPAPAVPILPLHVNVYLPPQPLPSRCHAWGTALGEILRARPEQAKAFIEYVGSIEGQELAVEYMNERYPATVAVAGSTPIFDPDNSRIRS